MDTKKIVLGSYLKKLRKDNNMTLRDLSKKLNITFVYISNIETGSKIPSNKILEKYAIEFKKPLNSLLTLKFEQELMLETNKNISKSKSSLLKTIMMMKDSELNKVSNLVEDIINQGKD